MSLTFPIANLLKRYAEKQDVACSIPVSGTFFLNLNFCAYVPLHSAHVILKHMALW